MIDLRKIVQAELKAVHPRVSFQRASENTVTPYLVYDITNIIDDGEGYQLVNIDIDGWDNKQDTTALETLMKNVNDRLNKKTVTTDKLAITFYLDRKIALIDDEPSIERRKYIYQGRLFERS